MQQFLKRVCNSRWAWSLLGLPSPARARALFHAKSYTMTSRKRCMSLWNLSQAAVDQNIPGDFVECGVWRGGSALIMGLMLQRSTQPRFLRLFDSFEGLPQPTVEDGTRAADYSGGQKDGKLVSVAQCVASLADVKRNLFDVVGIDPARVKFEIGWFQNTVPVVAPQMDPIAVLRLDGDWYASTQICLDHLYPHVSPGGVVILDDYWCWEGCKKATDEYRAKHSITAPLVKVDDECCYWIKP